MTQWCGGRLKNKYILRDPASQRLRVEISRKTGTAGKVILWSHLQNSSRKLFGSLENKTKLHSVLGIVLK